MPTERAPVTVRDPTPSDAAAIAAIHNEAIADRVATLETQLRDPDERRAWLAARSPRHPVLVAVDPDDIVVGWGSLNPFNARAVYDNVADFSVYVRRDHRGQGIGNVLLDALEARARALGYHKLVLAALARNAVGRRLYERHGFALVGTYHEQGRLDGEWMDVITMEKMLR
jgi:L-amino acid N-acyltransferase YncA